MTEIFKKIEYFIVKIIEKLENQKITLTAWLFSFFAIVYLRVILEVFSTRINYFKFENYFFLFFHIPAFFIFTALVIILILYFLTKEKIEKISKIALFAFLIILLPVIIDLIVTGGQGGIPVKYSNLSEMPKNILDFFQFFLKKTLHIILFVGQKSLVISNILQVNYGLKIEQTIVALGLIWYIFLKTKNIFKVFLGFILSVFFRFIMIAFPIEFYGKIASSLNPSFEHHHALFSLYFIFTCLLAALWFYIYNKEKFLALFKNLRLSRTANNITLLGLGLYLGEVLKFDLNFGDCLLIILAVISLLLYWLSAIGYDDLSDEKIDRISNPSRPLPQGKFTKEEFQNLSNLFRIASYYTAFAVGYGFFIFILLRSLVGYLYSSLPFRLKRFPILATLIKALAFLFTIYAGFLLISGNTIFDFPGKLAIFILIAFTLGATIKDIKDYEGDKTGGIYTIPVIFGLEKGKKIIGFLAFAAFILCPLFFLDYFNNLILPTIFAGILSFWLINRKEHGNKEAICLFLIYFSFGLFFTLTVF